MLLYNSTSIDLARAEELGNFIRYNVIIRMLRKF